MCILDCLCIGGCKIQRGDILEEMLWRKKTTETCGNSKEFKADLEKKGGEYLPSQRPDTGPVVQKHRFNVPSSPRLT